MLTRCPHCDTAFRVTPEQLKARQGRVRCGRCQAVFNALEALEEEAAAVPQPAEAAEGVEAPEALPDTIDLTGDMAPPAEPEADAPDEAGSDAELDELPPPAAADAEPAPTGPETASAAPADAAATEEAPEPEPIAEEPAAAGEAEAAAQEPLLYEEQPPSRRAWPWVLGLLAALLALGIQAAIAFRIELAVLAPEAKPLLVALCDLAGCEVGLPKKIELVGIETSDLHPDPAHPGRLQLDAELRNRAPFAQAWPHLELTLTDTADQALIRRVLPPREYLPAKLDPAAGFPASGEQAIHLDLETAGIPAAGYRLYIFYP